MISQFKILAADARSQIGFLVIALQNVAVFSLFLIAAYVPNNFQLSVFMLAASLFLMVTIIGVAAFSIFSRAFKTPINELIQSTNEIANGKSSEVLPVAGAKEVQLLGLAISEMVKGIQQDVSRVQKLAYLDSATQLPNREYFHQELDRSIRRSIRQKTTGAALFIDLDGFKQVNDTYGHDVGDLILSEFSKRLTKVLRAEDLVGFEPNRETPIELEGSDKASPTDKNKQMLARMGGDEFTVLLSELRKATDVAIVTKRIIAALEQPFDINNSKINIGASIGIATFPEDGSDYQTILKKADMAMYQAKGEGKNTYRFFSKELNEKASRRLEVEADLRVALDAGDQFELFYQPKFDCRTGTPVAVEALIRWNHPTKGLIEPVEFLTIAEECGLILPLGRWVIQEACEQVVLFEELGINLDICVNLAMAQIAQADFSASIIDVIKASGANPQRLELEISESAVMQDADKALPHMLALKEFGVRFAVDDFGSSQSSLAQLARLPFDTFKIDRPFVKSITDFEAKHSRVITRTIVSMANSLNCKTVAEGVETVEQLEFVKSLGCNFVQGFYLSKPLPQSEFLEWIADWQGENFSDRSVQSAVA